MINKIRKLRQYSFWIMADLAYHQVSEWLVKYSQLSYFSFLSFFFKKQFMRKSELINSFLTVNECDNDALNRLDLEISARLKKKPKDRELMLALVNVRSKVSSQSCLSIAQEYFELHKEDNRHVKHEVIPTNTYLGALGNHHLLSSLIMANELGFRDKKKLRVYVTKHIKLRNETLFRYCSQYFEVITVESLRLSSIRKDVKKSEMSHWGYLIDINNKVTSFEIADSFLHKKWQEAGKAPLLTLTEADKALGCEYLNQIGLPSDAWYVCFHMREPGYRDGGSVRENFRNVDPSTYCSAIKEVTERGGYVFRMGDSSMTPLPKMDRVIDYAHSNEKSDLLDVFLCASCRFMVGTSSGVYDLSRFFGVPILMTNLLTSSSTYSMPSNCIYLPRMVIDKSSQELMPLSKQLLISSNISLSSHSYSCNGYAFRSNTDEEIREGVREMFDLKYTDQGLNLDERDLQSKVDDITCKQSLLFGGIKTKAIAKISPSFISNHVDVLS